MSKWVIRNDSVQHRVGEPKECFDPNAMDGSFEFPSIEEGVRSLIGPDEVVVGSSTKRPVMRGTKVVGYIEVCDASQRDISRH